MVILAFLQWRSASVVIEAGFWFDDVTFELSPLDVEQLGGPLTAEEKAMIQDVAWQEMRAAYADLRLRLTDNRNAFYQRSRRSGSSGRDVQDVARRRRRDARDGAAWRVQHGQLRHRRARRVCVCAGWRDARRHSSRPSAAALDARRFMSLQHQLLGAQSMHSRDDRSYEYAFAG